MVYNIYNVHIIYQAFIQGSLFKAISPQRFSFFTVSLVRSLHDVPPIVGTKGKIFEI